MSEVLYTFTSNKFYAYLLSDLVFLKTLTDEIIRTFTDRIGRPLKREHKFNLKLLINK